MDDRAGRLDLSGAARVRPGGFPDGVNVEVCRYTGARYRRCGSTSAARGDALVRHRARGGAAVALRDAARDTGTITVDVPGGASLTITVTEDSCWLAGPAILLTTGTLTLP